MAFTTIQMIGLLGKERKREGEEGGEEKKRRKRSFWSGPLVTCRACRAVFSGGERDWLGCVSHIWNSSYRRRVERSRKSLKLSPNSSLEDSLISESNLLLSSLSFVSWTSVLELFGFFFFQPSEFLLTFPPHTTGFPSAGLKNTTLDLLTKRKMKLFLMYSWLAQSSVAFFFFILSFVYLRWVIRG